MNESAGLRDGNQLQIKVKRRIGWNGSHGTIAISANEMS